jgi:EAL domain-containing protein (putative c-di-GMP-specific phosphodiesterase class I)
MSHNLPKQSKPVLVIVDDEATVADFIHDVASDIGFNVSIFSDGDVFAQAYKHCGASVIILDLNLPGHDGIELLRFLGEQACQAKIIVSSGSDSRTIASAQAVGIQHKLDIHHTPLAKPFLVQDIEKVLMPLINHTGAISGADVRNALRNAELIVHYQPKVDLLSDNGSRLAGVEALVRWLRPDHGIVPPDKFIPIAQQEGLMVELTDVVMEQAIAAAHAWKNEGLDFTISINLDGALFDDLTLPDRLHAKAQSMGVPTKMLTLEVTESAAMADPAATMDILTRLRVKGFNLSMDDFGTGYSSLVQLYRLPFNELKIDKSFVMDIGNNAEAEIIVETLICLGLKLGIKICAEGIENQAMLDFVKKCGCHLGQGYLFSKPVEQSLVSNLARRYSHEGLLERGTDIPISQAEPPPPFLQDT